MEINLEDIINFGGHAWNCKSVVVNNRSYFSETNGWHYSDSTTIETIDDRTIDNFTIAIYETIEVDKLILSSEGLLYTGKELEKKKKSWIQDRHKNPKDRHRDTPARRMTRNKDPKDRHKDPKDRHRDTPERNADRHQDSNYYRKYYQQKLEREILIDTGMDLICCSCVEWKSVTSSKQIDTISNEKVVKYLIETDLTRNLDVTYYACKSSIDKDTKPRRGKKKILGFLNFPIELKDLLESQCKP